VPTRAETYTRTESIIGNWLANRPGARARIVLASKVAGPARNLAWVRGGSPDLTPQAIEKACDDSLRRLRTDCIDLYQIHWPNRNVPAFGAIYFDPAKDESQTPVDEQLRALAGLVQAGKVRWLGLSNETPWGLTSFLHAAERHGLPRVVSVQNSYSLVNRSVDNGLDEVLHHAGVGLIAYSPLAFGVLTGKYDAGLDERQPGQGRLARFESMRRQRWGRPETMAAAAEYNALAASHGLTPTQLAISFCVHSRRVANTLLGVTTIAQLDEDLDAAATPWTPALQQAVDEIRWRRRDPAQ
jgi:aryl-alcohol dehydrogenase-like predicted oxidoreductase